MENNITEKDEISLIDLLAVLFRYKWMIIITTGLAAIIILVYSVVSLKLPPEKSYLPNKYRSEALMLINDSSSEAGGLSQALSASGLGGMASLMGVNVSGGGQSYSKLAIFLAGSNSFLDSVIQKFDLIKRYNITKNPKANSRKALSERISADFSNETGVFKISFEDIDPEFAKEVVLFCVDYYEKKFFSLGLDKDLIEKENVETALNSCTEEIENISKQIHSLDNSVNSYYPSTSGVILKVEKLKMELTAQRRIYTELKAKYEMLKIKMKSHRPIIQILEMPEAPDQKSGPSRGKLCVVVTVAAFFLSIFMAFFLNAAKNIKKDFKSSNYLKGKDNEEK